jgi:hypothetical protein
MDGWKLVGGEGHVTEAMGELDGSDGSAFALLLAALLRFAAESDCGRSEEKRRPVIGGYGCHSS